MEEYRFINKNGIDMIDVVAINRTEVAMAYCTTRHGGVSTGTTASMNCNLYKDLDKENGQKNFRIFCQAIGVDPGKVITNRLIANTDICRYVNSADIIDIYNEAIIPRADGLITDCRDITLFMYAADCAIIMLLDNANKCIGMLHAGWRGSLGNIIPNTINAMKDRFHTDERNLIAVICPSISAECFEVGDDVVKLFFDRGFGRFVSRKNDKPHIDLYGVNKLTLMDSGILEDNISTIELCTCLHEDLFHSYRRGPVNKNGMHLNGMNGMFLKLL